MCGPNTIGVGLARVGASNQTIISGTLQELIEADFGPPLHSLVIAGEMHFLEADALNAFAVNAESIGKYGNISPH